MISPLGPAAARKLPTMRCCRAGLLTGYQTMDLLRRSPSASSSPRPSTSWVLPMTSAWP
ncbi:MAG: hypothetical protein ACLU0O_11125 [Collinsella sp.]